MPQHDRFARGRGAALQSTNPYLSVQLEDDWEQVAQDEGFLAELGRPKTVYLPDASQSIVSQNNSPDIGFRYSVNPYRGCAHGCSYCYARPTHEYLGLSAGLDFETKVMVKHRAPKLLRDWLARPKWTGELIVFSGVTDCYQPAERQFELTRGCLQVAAECGQCVTLITKNALVTRDLDLLADMARRRLVRVAISITTLDAQLARVMEPQTSSPAARLRALEQLSSAGISTIAMLAPIIPGLNDSEIPSLLAAVRDAGAQRASYTLLRLPGSVHEIFAEWLQRHRPNEAEKVMARIRSTRDGQTNDSRFGKRMRGTGNLAEQINQTFHVFAKRYQLDKKLEPLDSTAFVPPRPTTGQLRLF